MSATIVLVPVLITAWPMLAASVVAVAASAGFKVSKKPEEAKKLPKVDIDMGNIGAVADSLSHGDRIAIEREGVRVLFSRDARGQFKACVEGDLPKEELRAIGEEIAGKVIQRYVYQRLAQELEHQGFVTLDEEKGVDETIRIHVRRHED